MFSQQLANVLKYGEESHARSNSLLTWSAIYPGQSSISSNRSDSFEDILDFDWNILMDKPLVSGNALEEPKTREIFGLSAILFFVWISSSLSLLNGLERIFDKSRDKVIFLTPSEIIPYLWKNSIFEKIGWKIILDADGGDIYVPPYSFEGSGMKRIRHLSEKPNSNQFMGGLIRGREFRGTSFDLAPFHTEIDNIGGVPQLDGFTITMMDHFAEYYNFSYTLDYVGSDYGQLLDNGSYTGLIGQMADPELGYDFALIFAYEDFSFGTATFPSYGQVQSEVVINFVTQHGMKKLPWYAILQSFTWSTWIWSGISYISLCICQALVMKLQGVKSSLIWDAATIQPFSLLMEQGLAEIPRGLRFISCILLLGGTILGTGYKSMLRANIAFPQKEIVPITFPELLDRSDYKIHMLSLGMEDVLTEGNPHIQKMFAQKRINLVLEPDFNQWVEETFLGEKSVLIFYNVIESFIIGSIMLSRRDGDFPLLFSQDYVYFCQANFALVHQSPYRDSFNLIIYAGIESGLYGKNEDMFKGRLLKAGSEKLRENPDSDLMKKIVELKSSTEHSSTPLTVNNLRISFAIVLLGSFVAFLAFFWERKWHLRILNVGLKFQERSFNGEAILIQYNPDF